jgi:glycosyltransferase involved in cell wall biosynthesis
LHAFLDEFDVSESVQMIVKVQNRSRVVDPPQLAIWAQIDVLVAQSPNITLVDEYLPYHQVLQLISGADAYVSLHRSEGLGLGILEAMSLGTPVVVTNYSGNVDFCDGTTAYVVDYDEVAVGSSDYPYTRPGHRWAEPDLGSAREQLRLVVEDSVLREQRSAAAQHLARTSFSADAIGLRYRTRIEEVIGART